MSIERNEPIRFHEKGTLEAVTRWIATHHDGIAEWLKNVRRQHQVDRANVAENHRVAALLLQDARDRSEEHTSELQSHFNLVRRLLLEKKTHNTPHPLVRSTTN